MDPWFEKIGIVIPALNPDIKMLNLIQDLKRSGFVHVFLVDDGSTKKNRSYFDMARTRYDCHIFHHAVNRGKGAALKTAFNQIIDNYPMCKGVVTVDCDGQHRMEDTIVCAQMAYEHPDSLILGCRQFHDDSIPWRSRFGNNLTRQVIKLLCGIHVSDTQTGLRGISTSLLKKYFIGTAGERFEYEMNMLIDAKDHQVPILEFPIETIYIENNESSHFNPFIDSIRIYGVFVKFMLSSLSSFLIDIILYWLFGLILRPFIPESTAVFGISVFILLRTVISRLLSSLYNFFMNKHQVFKNDSKSPAILVKYYILCVVQLLCSAILVNHLLSFIAYSTVRKCIIDTILFAISFQIQREWVFKRKAQKK